MKKSFFALLLTVVFISLAAGALAAGTLTEGAANQNGGMSGVGNSARDGFSAGAEGEAGDTVLPGNSISGDQTSTDESLESIGAEEDASSSGNRGAITVGIVFALGVAAVIAVALLRKRS